MDGTQEPEDLLIGALLAIALQALYREVMPRMADRGFADYRAAHRRVFQYLGEEGNRITELAERAQMTKQSMGELIRYLEEHGYVERLPDPTDRRAYLIRRTERGWALNQAARKIVEQVQADWTERLGEEKMEQLLRLLRELVRLVGETRVISVDPRSRHARSHRR